MQVCQLFYIFAACFGNYTKKTECIKVYTLFKARMGCYLNKYGIITEQIKQIQTASDVHGKRRLSLLS